MKLEFHKFHGGFDLSHPLVGIAKFWFPVDNLREMAEARSAMRQAYGYGSMVDYADQYEFYDWFWDNGGPDRIEKGQLYNVYLTSEEQVTYCALMLGEK